MGFTFGAKLLVNSFFSVRMKTEMLKNINVHLIITIISFKQKLISDGQK